MNKEIWKDIPGYEGLYQASNLGRIKSLFRYKKILNPYINEYNGYVYVILSKNKKQKCCRVHRLIAQTFLINRENKPYVNHIDGNKQNNCIENLEWCTAKENTQHAFKNNLIKIKKGKENHMYGKRGKEHWNSKKVMNIEKRKIYNSFGEAARELNIINASNIISVCKGKREIAYGYHWKYVEE